MSSVIIDTKLGLSWAPMQPADLPWVATAEAQLHPFPWAEKSFADALAAGYRCWMLRLNERNAGYAVVMTVLDEAHLLNISVAAELQGQGLGQWLLEQLCVESKTSGATQIFLEVRPSNASAVRLYRRTGFELLSIRKAYYRAVEGREDALVMRKELI